MFKRTALSIAAFLCLSSCGRADQRASLSIGKCWPNVRPGMTVHGKAQVYLNIYMAALYQSGCDKHVLPIANGAAMFSREHGLLVQEEGDSADVIAVTFDAEIKGVLISGEKGPLLRLSEAQRVSSITPRRTGNLR